MRVHFIVHEAFEAPGAYEHWAKDHQYDISYSRVYLGDPLPTSLEAIDFLIIMGGPQSPTTTIDSCPYFDSHAEQALIAKAAKAEKVVVGVCLGAQLVGEAFGAPCIHSPEKEIGMFPIMLTEEGKASDMTAHFGSPLDVGHWHSDMPGVTPQAHILAYSEGCPHQIIAYSALVYGFQCHMELTPDVIELLIRYSADDFHHAKDYRFVEIPTQLRKHNYEEMNQKLFVFLDKLTALYTSTIAQ